MQGIREALQEADDPLPSTLSPNLGRVPWQVNREKNKCGWLGCMHLLGPIQGPEHRSRLLCEEVLIRQAPCLDLI